MYYPYKQDVTKVMYYPYKQDVTKVMYYPYKQCTAYNSANVPTVVWAYYSALQNCIWV